MQLLRTLVSNTECNCVDFAWWALRVNPCSSTFNFISITRSRAMGEWRRFKREKRVLLIIVIIILFLSLTGGVGNAANICYKRLASMLSEKWDLLYSITLAWMRRKLSFSFLRSSIQCIRGARSAACRASRDVVLPVDLVVSEAGFNT